MALDEDQIEELKADVAAARKRDLHFAICLGKKPEETVLITHRLKDPETLLVQAKRAGETPKVAFGVMRVKGKEILLLCGDKPPTGLARKVKQFMHGFGIKVTVKVIDAQGGQIEDDDG